MCVQIQPEISRLEHILAHRADCETVNVAAFTVHFDDSGTNPEAPVAVIAGWVSPVTQWKKFIRAWNKVKNEYGFSEFHMAEFIANNPKSEFADTSKWTEHRKAIVLHQLCNVINSHAVQGFCTSVIKNDYDEIVPQEVKDLAGRFHYTFALRGAIGFMEQWRKEQAINEPIEYIFDFMTKSPARNEIDQVFEDALLIDNPLHRYGIYPGCHSFRSRKDVMPLQAADMLAWLSRRAHGVERQGIPMPQYAANEWNHFLLRNRVTAKYQNRAQLAQMTYKGPQSMLATLDGWKKLRANPVTAPKA